MGEDSKFFADFFSERSKLRKLRRATTKEAALERVAKVKKAVTLVVSSD